MTVDLDVWAENFQGRAAAAIATALRDVVGDHDPADIVALGVYTDADAVSVVAAACTRDHLARLQAEDDGDPEYYRWATNEWDLNGTTLIEAGGPDALADLETELSRVSDQVERGEAGDDTTHVFRFIAWGALVNAMTILFNDGFYDPFVDAVQVFEAVDAGVDGQTQREWITQVNTDEDAAAFSRWLAASDHD